MSLRVAMRPNVVLGLLAVAAFAAALGLANRDRLPWAGSSMASGEGALSVAASRDVSTSRAEANASMDSSRRAASSTNALAGGPSPQAQAPSQARPSTHRDPTPEQLQTIARLADEVMPREETTSEDAERRGDAIRQLATLPGPQAAQALVHAIRNDADPRNRILAVESLRRAGAGGDSNWVIRDALREASSSSDEVIAAQARAAYDELIAKLGEQR